jgi:metal-dependent hydrolase (beta-lactamase superfamily II)
MLEAIRDGRDDIRFRLVLGGFHLVQHPANAVQEILGRFRELGVERCGAAHCTGAPAIEMFREAYDENFVETGVGAVVRLASDTPPPPPR